MTRLTLAAVMLLTAAADAQDAQPAPRPRTAFVCLTDAAGAITCHAVSPPTRLEHPTDEETAAMRLSDSMVRFLAEHRASVTGCWIDGETLVCLIPPGTRAHSIGVGP